LVGERQREGLVPWNLVRVADNRQLLVVVTHFIGLKVNAVESAASNLPARLYVSNKFQVHIYIIFVSKCKDKGFLNESVSEFHQSCIKPLIFCVFATCG
jgi:hypothetical protein